MLHDDKKVIRSDFDRETADKMAPVLSRVGGHHPDPVPSLSISINRETGTAMYKRSSDTRQCW